MKKEDLIKKLTSEKYLSICKRLTKGRDHKDLLQELVLHFLEQSDELIEKIREPDAYIYRTLLSLISKRGKFHEKYRMYICKDIKPQRVEQYDYKKENDLIKVEKALNEIYWCDREILKVYLDKGSSQKTAKDLNIPLSSAKVIINRAKQTIKQKMTKPKILICMQHRITALQYHRQYIPHERLSKIHPDAFEFIYNRPDKAEEEVSIMWMTDEQLKEYSLVIFLRQIAFNQSMIQPSIDRLKRMGIKILIDIDDYWIIPHTHPMYAMNKAHNIASSTISTLKQVDWVTTTTDYFVKKISEYNTNITILPNCISPSDKQFESRELNSPRVRFGWIGGIFHGTDMLMAKASFGRFNSSGLLNDIQICLGGFNIGNQTPVQIAQLKTKFKKDKKHIINDQRTDHKHKILARENINFMLNEYLQMEEILSDDYKICDRDYVTYLRQYTQAAEHISYDKPYRRLWGKEIDKYGELYNEIDVALVPLKDTEFNKCKSELKIVEAGWMGKAVIVSDISPYTEWIKDGVNGIKVSPTRNHIDWYLAVKKLANEPNMRKDLSLALQETIKENFDLDKNNLKRVELYKQLTK